MSCPVTTASFEALANASGLMQSSELEILRAECPNETKTAAGFAQLLVDRKLMTKWQARKLLAGRHRGFFLGAYRLQCHLARGGMSTLYVGRHEETGQERVLKVLSPDKAHQASYLPRFRREAKMASELCHDNIVQAFELLQVSEGGTELYCMVMEYLRGRDLYQKVVQDGPLPLAEAVDLIRQAATGLEHAHQCGLVHRDVKPGNLFVTNEGQLKVVDLGLAAVLESPEESVTRTCNERVLGTADYLAPEQAIDSHRADARADIYALGCTFYFALAGVPPFPNGSLAERILAHQTRDPKRISRRRADIPEELAALLDSMLVKRRAQRTQTCHEVAERLTTWLEERGGDPAFNRPPRMKDQPKVRKLRRVKARQRPAPVDVPTAAILAHDTQMDRDISVPRQRLPRQTDLTTATPADADFRGSMDLDDSHGLALERGNSPAAGRVRTIWPGAVDRLGPPGVASVALLSTFVLTLADPAILRCAFHLLTAVW